MNTEISEDRISLHSYKKITEFEEINGYIIKCSNCRKALVDIRILVEGTKKRKFRASCPFCRDKSFIEEVQGDKLYVGGITEFVDSVNFIDKTYTKVVDIVPDDDYTMLTVEQEI